MTSDEYWDRNVRSRCLWLDSKSTNGGNECDWCKQEIDVEDLPATATCSYCGYDTFFDEDPKDNLVYAIKMMSRADRAYLDWLSVKYGRNVDYYEAMPNYYSFAVKTRKKYLGF